MNKQSVFSGNLTFLSLADLIQIIGNAAYTGWLRIRNPMMPEPGIIHFVEGHPVDAACGTETGIEALYPLFGWIDGEFQFFHGDPVPRRIEAGRMEIILEGLRRLDDGQIPKIDGDHPRGGTQPGEGTDLPLVGGSLVDYRYIVDEEIFPAGEKIVEEGKHGCWIWVVLRGKAEIVRDTRRGPLQLVRIGAGGFIGSMSTLLWQGSVRSATAVAVNEVRVGVLDLHRLSSEYSRLSPTFRQLILSLDRRLRRISDRICERFGGVTDPISTLFQDTPVASQGRPIESLFRVDQGRGSIAHRGPKGHMRLFDLERGDYWGEIPFLDVGNEPNTASVFGGPGFQYQPVDLERLRIEFEGASPTLRRMLQHLASCISATSALLYRMDESPESGPKSAASNAGLEKNSIPAVQNSSPEAQNPEP